VIRVLVVDDHHAIRAGLVALLRQEPGFVPVATAPTAAAAIDVVTGEDVDVAIVDYHLPDATGIELCHRLPDDVSAVIYTGVPLDTVVIAALVAGARGVVSKAAPAEELFDAMREVARGRAAHPPVPPQALAAAGRRIGEEDLPIIGMALDHTTPAEMADALRIATTELQRRISRVLDALQPRPSRHLARPRA
jgi:DNA-binding NarL/FixJ family response regulator